ncbi:hypothetical protein BRCON_0962 [Candidatus Sumerlaea chitinivorans]|uniref:Uncharacterized protein n=1 Tax=Sumerlaea chitinivorans TaxID=2250252 RepID=A0A2Z4Y421_SUMC1|nr:hypothetical protein BRCON_0962 [Candidatus Sumerlaea chitinivorans]
MKAFRFDPSWERPGEAGPRLQASNEFRACGSYRIVESDRDKKSQ